MAAWLRVVSKNHCVRVLQDTPRVSCLRVVSIFNVCYCFAPNVNKADDTFSLALASINLCRTMKISKFVVCILIFFVNGWVVEEPGSDSDEDIALASIALYLSDEPPAKRRRRSVWVHPMNDVRKAEGEYHTGHQRLVETDGTDDDRFFAYYRMSNAQFEEIHSLVEERIYRQNTNYRESISTRERLAITLR